MTELHKIAAAMGGEVKGDKVLFPTPGHSKKDRGSIASICPDAPDGVLIHSFNGGDPLAIKDEMRARGVLPERATSGRGDWRIISTHEFTDESGAVLYRTRRHEHPARPKRYTVERPDGRGGWLDKIGDARRVLYRLPELLASDAAETVFLVEGERKADKLASMGFTATAIAFGSKSWRKHYAEALAGRCVAILPDNDEPGQAFATEARGDIERAGGKAVLVDLPGLPPKGDIIDWNGSAAELRSIVDATVNPPPDLLPLVDIAAWQGLEAPARQWALTDWIPARQATYLTGPGSAGKSLLAQQLCTCIAARLPFLGVETQQATAIYITCEDDEDELHRRQKAICEALGVRLSDLAGKLHLVSLASEIGNELATFDVNGKLALSSRYRALSATLEHTGAGFVALDNVAHLFAGNENIRNHVAAFCGLLNRLAQESDSAILFLGHPNKAGDSFSGSTAWENQVRSRLFLETPKDKEGEASDLDARMLTRGKANYAKAGARLDFRWHRWAFVTPNNVPPDYYAECQAASIAASENERFLKCLAKATAEKRAVSPSKSASNYAPRTFAIMPTGKPYTEKQFEAAMQRLLHLGTIENGMRVYQRDNRAWVTGLGVAPTLAPTPAQTPAQSCTNPPANPHKPCTDLHALTPPYTTYKPGAATEPPAPDDDDIIWDDDGEDGSDG
ncbi:AAA family ATPase [Blastomonas sp.]|uniref:AAA family ATPase n=1 Tax=Blastomonas sp. TaxID=1909299 RepID=UPI0035939388